MKSLLLVVLFYGLAQGKPKSDSSTLVSTNVGLIRGVRGEDDTFTKFLGVPYGLVNETDPFGAAIPHPGFETTFNANDSSNFCLQLTSSGDVGGSLQCLELHMYVPDTASSDNPLPVMVWIHGGGFSAGKASGEYPETLIKHDVIVISVGYRLGIFGFLCLDTPEYPGNQGFKDQILALRWIKDNIASFGGDPDNVTPFGQSAGGMAVNAHLYSEYEQLFDKVIIQSGPAVSNWFFVPSHPYVPVQLATYLGYNTTDMNEAVAILATVDPAVLAAATFDTGLISSSRSDASKIKPCVEKKFDGVQNFISEFPVNIKKAPKVNSTSIMIGYVSEETGQGFTATDGPYDEFEYNLNLAFDLGDKVDELVELIKHFYVGDAKEIGSEYRKPTADYRDDLVFNHATQRMTEQFVDSGAKAVYRYEFSYCSENATGAVHGSEVPFLFDENQYFTNTEKTEAEQLLTDQMIAMWSNFAKYGNPTPEVTDLLPVEWKPATKDDQYSLDLDTELTLVSRPEQERMTFWDLFYKSYRQYQIGYKEVN